MYKTFPTKQKPTPKQGAGLRVSFRSREKGILEPVAKTKGKSVPAKASTTCKVESRSPIQRDVHGDGELEFNTQLAYDGSRKSKRRIVVGILAVPHSNVSTGSYIEVADTCICEDEIVNTGKRNGVAHKSEVGLKEVPAEVVLVREFCTVADTKTEGTRLCRSCK